MEEIVVKLDIPLEFKDKFELALIKAVKQLARRVEFSIADDILSDSKLTDDQSLKLADELKEQVAKKHRF